MKYLALIYGSPEGGEEESMEPWIAYETWLKEEGVEIVGDALQPIEMATTLRMKGSEVVPLDGPFAETKEVLGGYYVFECANLDRALHLARQCPIIAQGGCVEVRPVLELDL